ncbi:hypothetical protein FIU83_00280 [Halomonas sp. THAF5a]|uniref:hypothetical protein n=1 Tax=Halomonas sp. THAF5a TaxID=2587844 RepID=UPI00126872F2|nr:hypothetical protein [Halomonas sp. THAF5a]QFU00074.1 hypothetical protein FIU83_00280 [Halomonas sp. THAF5a]
MRQFLFPRRPLARATVLTCHLLLQLGLLAAAALWLVPQAPWLTMSDATPHDWLPLALGGGLWLLAAMALRLVAELALLPHHQAAPRPGFAPAAVVTRSYARRPAVYDEAEWSREARRAADEEDVVGPPRVVRRATDEPTLDLARPHEPEPAANEPRL